MDCTKWCCDAESSRTFWFELSGGQVSINNAAIVLLANIDIKNANILGDKAYGTKEIRTYITSQDAAYTIPPKSNTKQ